MSVTEHYSRTHRALFDMSAAAGINAFDLRVLIAVDDGYARTDYLETMLECDGSAVRRSTTELRAAGLATVRGNDGGAARRGVRSVLTLTPKGSALVAKFRATLTARQEAAA